MHKESSHWAVLAGRDFRLYFIGYATSLLGSAMAPVALVFAILNAGGTASQTGGIMAATILPIVLFLPWGGVVADRLGSRRVMMAADVLRCMAQATLAAAVGFGHPALWTFLVLAALRGTGEGFFTPGLTALVPRLVIDPLLPAANASMSVARSAATVAGPATAGLLVATCGPAVALFVDAATYAVSVLVLALIRLSPQPTVPRNRVLSDLREGWLYFRSTTWLWVMTLQFSMFNLLVTSPFYVLGPVVAERRFGGAAAWGTTMALYGTGAVIGGLFMLRRTFARPLVAATITGACWALPNAALGLSLKLTWVAGAALLAGVGMAISGTLTTTMTQRHVPPAVLARISSFNYFGSYALGPLGLIAAGPVAAAVGIAPVLLVSAAWQAFASACVLIIPQIRHLPSESTAKPVSETVA
ncbi:MFS transporter [Streptomyces rhizosphaericus]|uniref:MFS transporter n=1 Tax=Streptomyces rhizosphaericus TaxID=114699 RepID=A0A6G4AEH8_9ACTN|nr:MFS transporter [Streptomyces rhizosphaericus]NEW71099.1 MFS transporter [Streptomyces rhizosphaericus]